LAGEHPPKCPHVALTNLTKMHLRDDDRDTLYGFGTPTGALAFTTAIFRATHPSSSRNEFDFECQVGFGGVDLGAPKSASSSPAAITGRPGSTSASNSGSTGRG
jgi:hypothetical protein